jgi:hypothetical protein
VHIVKAPVFVGVRGAAVQRVSEFSFYELASKIHPLVDMEEVKLSEVWFQWYQARTELSSILDSRPLSVSVDAAGRLYTAITAFVPEKWEDAIAAVKPNPLAGAEVPLAAWQTYPIRTAAKDFETVLAAECQVLDTYFVSKKGVYSTADLVDHAHHHIPEPTRAHLPEQCKGDFDQAGKCIAFDVATAAAFHLLRGTEAVLREYYDAVVPGAKKAPAKMRNWGVYINLLGDHGAESKVISLLIHLKDAYRNPVLHPEENYTDERVQVLFGVCVSAIVMMVEEINKLKAKSPTLPFSIAPTNSLAAAVDAMMSVAVSSDDGAKSGTA